MNSGKIESFKDLIVWQEGHKLVLMIYKTTNAFPKTETYSLTDQMRRAATSITANFAEGFGRQTYKEKVQFYYQSKGSLAELDNFLTVARDLYYLNNVAEYDELSVQLNKVGQLLQAFIKKSKTFINQK